MKKNVNPFPVKKHKVYDKKRLYNYGLWHLSRREFGRDELKQKMKHFQDDLSIIDEVLDTLESNNFLSNERRIKMLINQYINNEGLKKVKYRLSQKKLPQELIEKALGELGEDEESENRKAFAVLKKKFSEYDKSQYAKMVNFLLRRGFSFSSSKSAINSLEKGDDEFQ